MRCRFVHLIASASLLMGNTPTPLLADTPPPDAVAAPNSASPVAEAPASESFNSEQLDALLAPVALYPDTLLVQTLMATVYPLDVVAASRWLADGNNKSLNGAALETALKSQNWDVSVKSLVPFPQVIEMLNQHLEWTQQLGYAMQTQQPDVFDAVQRLRAQAHAAGNLNSNDQQVVSVEPPPPPPAGAPPPPADAPQQVIVIQPAQPDVVYVPAYNPTVVYGAWPYPATPPVYYPPPPGYYAGNALLTGLAFGAGVAITAGLWGWARPSWGCCWGRGWGGYSNVNININRYNNISTNRPWQGGANGAWRANNPNYRQGGGLNRPNGPVGRPTRPTGLSANAIGRPNVSVPGNVVRPPNGMGPANRPGIGQGNRPGAGQGAGGQGNRPGIGQGNRPGAGQGTGGPGNRPGIGQGNRPGAGQGAGGPGNPPGIGQGNRPGAGQGAGGQGNPPGIGQGNRPGAGQGAGGQGNRPGIGQGNRPGAGQGAGGEGNRPQGRQAAASRPPQKGAFGGMSDGRQAGQFDNRGAQSRQSAGAGTRAQARGGAGGARGGTGGARGGAAGGARGAAAPARGRGQ
jgi:hypothetical protein